MKDANKIEEEVNKIAAIVPQLEKHINDIQNNHDNLESSYAEKREAVKNYMETLALLSDKEQHYNIQEELKAQLLQSINHAVHNLRQDREYCLDVRRTGYKEKLKIISANNEVAMEIKEKTKNGPSKYSDENLHKDITEVKEAIKQEQLELDTYAERCYAAIPNLLRKSPDAEEIGRSKEEMKSLETGEKTLQMEYQIDLMETSSNYSEMEKIQKQIDYFLK